LACRRFAATAHSHRFAVGAACGRADGSRFPAREPRAGRGRAAPAQVGRGDGPRGWVAGREL